MPSPAGKIWSQAQVPTLVESHEHILWICGRFAGIDQRIIDELVDAELSLGDYVISGGELAALIIADSMVRFIPQALNNPESKNEDSFSPRFNGYLEHPLYTRPQNFEGKLVPKELLSGNHKSIREWKLQQSDEKTKKNRPDLKHFL